MGEYLDLAYLKNPSHQSDRAPRLERHFGSDTLYGIFGKGAPPNPKIIEHIRKRDPNYQPSRYLAEADTASSKAAIPWSPASRNTAGLRYDPTLVKDTIYRADIKDIAEFDPRYLHGSQPSITSSGVLHYLEKGQSGPLNADADDIGNQFPFVYIHQGTGEMRLVGGHHRATSALLKGEPLVARYAIGDY
jgi:hypothetical protein